MGKVTNKFIPVIQIGTVTHETLRQAQNGNLKIFNSNEKATNAYFYEQKINFTK